LKQQWFLRRHIEKGEHNDPAFDRSCDFDLSDSRDGGCPIRNLWLHESVRGYFLHNYDVPNVLQIGSATNLHHLLQDSHASKMCSSLRSTNVCRQLRLLPYTNGTLHQNGHGMCSRALLQMHHYLPQSLHNSMSHVPNVSTLPDLHHCLHDRRQKTPRSVGPPRSKCTSFLGSPAVGAADTFRRVTLAITSSD
jgi:hypothetical protein